MPRSKVGQVITELAEKGTNYGIVTKQFYISQNCKLAQVPQICAVSACYYYSEAVSPTIRVRAIEISKARLPA